MTAPLVPVDVDLRNFSYMPLDVRRLLTSETWIEAADTPKVAHALMCLWAESWHQVPAASLPNNSRVLARLAMCDSKTWKKISVQVLESWIECDDGLLYHPVVAEKALQAWEEKLAQKARTSAATAAREAKRRAQHDPSDVGRDEDRDEQRNEQRNVERDVHQGKGREGKEELLTERSSPPRGSAAPPAAVGVFEDHDVPRATPNPVAPLAIALNAKGVRCTAMNPDLIAAHAEGVTPEHLTALTELPEFQGKPATYVIRAARREHAERAAPISTGPPRQQPMGKTATAIAILEQSKRERQQQRLADGRDRDGNPEAPVLIARSHTGS